MPPIADAVTGWTPRDFASEYASFALVNVTYQNVAAATALSVLVQAIELANSLDSSLVRDFLSNTTFFVRIKYQASFFNTTKVPTFELSSQSTSLLQETSN